jgi:hypothetical protein
MSGNRGYMELHALEVTSFALRMCKDVGCMRSTMLGRGSVAKRDRVSGCWRLYFEIHFLRHCPRNPLLGRSKQKIKRFGGSH